MLAKVSVVIPIYNSENYLESCILSVLNQSYSNVELILVNDGSTDNSLEICKKYEKPSKVILVDKINNGVSSARNSGINNASGDFIVFVDSDDYLPKDAIETLLDGYKKEEDVDFVYGPFVYEYDNGKSILHKLRLSAGIYETDSLKDRFLDDGTLSGILISSACGVLYKMSVIREHNLQFNEKLKINEDGLFNLEYIMKVNHVKVLDRSVYTVRKHDDSSTHTRSVDDDFNSVIYTYLTQNGYTNVIPNLELQFSRRNVTLALFDIIIYPKQYSFWNAYRFIRSKVSDKKVRSSLIHVKNRELKSHKRLMYYLMKHKCTFFLLLNSVYIIPFLNSRISR